jgi:DNA-binding transcriptional regulator YiaG
MLMKTLEKLSIVSKGMSGEEIKSIRLALGLRHEQFALLARVSETTIWRWEAGTRYPSRRQLSRLNELARDLQHVGD